MELVDTIVNLVVLAAVGGLLSMQTRRLRAELAEYRRENREEHAEMRHEFRSEVAILRSDLTQVALAVGAKPRASGDR